MSAGVISLKTVDVPPKLVIEKDEDVPNTCWSQVRSEIGERTMGSNRLTAPAEKLFANRSALRSILGRYQVKLSVDSRTEDLLRRRKREANALRDALDEPELEKGLEPRLQRSRFTRKLFLFQKRDLRKLISLAHGANFSVPGAGKTCVTYALYELERQNERVTQMLVVAPLSAFDSWEREAREALDPSPVVSRYENSISEDTEVLLTGYQRLWSNYEDIAAWVSDRRTHVVLDEAHRMKAGRSGEWGSTCLNLAYSASRRDILTGTPAPNSPEDMVSELDFLWPTHGARLIPEDLKTSRPPRGAGSRIAERIGPLFVRTQKSELGLPEPEHEVRRVSPDELQENIYDALRRRYAGRFRLSQQSQIDFAKMGEVVMYLLEAATNPSLLVSGSSEDDPETFRHPPLKPSEDSDLYRLLEDYSSYETPPKFRVLGAILERNASRGQKTLVWTNFVKNIRTLYRMLPQYNPALLYGDIPMDPSATRNRESEISRFRNDDDCTVLIANPSAASEGMSLHRACHHAVYLERTFNAGQYLQSLNRIHRLGLPDGTTTKVTFLQTEGTIDEVVHQRVHDKAERLGQMLNDPDIPEMELPSAEDFGPPLQDEEDVNALFDHFTDEK